MAIAGLSLLCVLLFGGLVIAFLWLRALHQRDDDYDEYLGYLLPQLEAQGILEKFQVARQAAYQEQREAKARAESKALRRKGRGQV